MKLILIFIAIFLFLILALCLINIVLKFNKKFATWWDNNICHEVLGGEDF